MSINFITVIITIINFIILLLILKHFFWEKISVAIEERQKSIMDRMDSADKEFKAGTEFKVENEKILSLAKEEGKKITEARKKKAEKIYDEILDNAKSETSAMKERAENDINRELDKAKFEIKEQVIELALVVSKKALEKSLDEAEHRRLIDSFISEVI
ncbi:F0F1 ATP synthase subunit B [uncultured Clostridium sp.]|uniref:F0F1 ATP synthase subunit B n=1 Tax=uncultured Clostridium sp. TaxID=59620 RepID=UPI002628A5CC|nr:F0F1 ATP synthase subunit B [uncultured Clostridium sp.]